MKTTLLILMMTGLRAQEVPVGQGVMTTFTLQPLETFKATFTHTLKGVALYSAVVCNQNATVMQQVTGGQVYQAGWERGLYSVSRQLNQYTISATRRKSKLYVLSRVLVWLSYGAQIYVTSKGDRISSDLKQVPNAVQGAMAIITGVFDSEGSKGADLVLLDPKEVIQLGPKGKSSCEERLMLGTYRKDPIGPVEIR